MTIYSKIVGVTFDNPDGISRQKVIESLEVSSPIKLKRDRENNYDKNAIMVVDSQSQQLGYLSKDIARQLAPIIDDGKLIKVEICSLTGGGEYNRGVNIRIEK
jgi:hypothetical protein